MRRSESLVTGRAMLGIAHRREVNATVRNLVAFVNYIADPPALLRSIASTEIAPEMPQRPLACERRCRRVVGTSLVAIEPVIGRIDEHLDIRMRRGEALDVFDRDA